MTGQETTGQGTTGQGTTGQGPPARTGSAAGRALGVIARHPLGAVQFVFFALVAVVVLQNLESTSFDVLFWSIPTFPKLVLIFFSMLVGAAAWEILRRRVLR